MILSDFDLRGYIKDSRLVVKPFNENTVRENGIDLRVGNEIAVRNESLGTGFVVDPYDEKSVSNAYVVKKEMHEFIVPRMTQILMVTKEYLELPDNLVGFVELRSTWCRHGISIPPSIIDAGFRGTITLEVINNGPYPIKLKPGTRFAHVIFATTLNRVKKAYAGSYLGQQGVRPPKVVEEPEPDEG